MWMSGLGHDGLPRRSQFRYRVPIWTGTLAVAGALALVPITQDAVARHESSAPPAPDPVVSSPAAPEQLAGPVASDIVVPAPKPSEQLQAALTRLAQDSGANVAIALESLDQPGGLAWSLAGTEVFESGSTYKLPVLEWQAQAMAAGTVSGSDQLCYQDSDWEDGWFGDYADGSCFSRLELMQRVGEYSDNTAAHILVDSMGGPDALQQFAVDHGATSSDFVNGSTTAADLVTLWTEEARGQLGGPAAQSILYPLLTHTAYEQGVPAGVPTNVQVVHKVGIIDSTVNDAALVVAPSGRYVLVVLTDGLDQSQAWPLIAQISADVYTYETS